MTRKTTRAVPAKVQGPKTDARDRSRSWFTVADSTRVVQHRAGPKADPRTRFVMNALIKHLHAFVKETELTMEEWMQGIQFLTATGHMCTEWRQEFILLSDVLGVSMLVDALNHGTTPGATESTVLGPFHVAGAPRYPNGANICLDGKGEPVWVEGRVLKPDGRPLAGAEVDVWQANEDGFYDVQQKGVQPDMNLRGLFTTDRLGRFSFRSVYPRHYPIPVDGPVGKLLTALDRTHTRPAHLHFKVTARGHAPLTTHLFTPDCPWLGDDAVFGVKESLIADFKCIDDPKLAKKLGMPNPFRKVTWDFVLEKV